MRIKRILNFVKVKVSEYPRIDSIVESLEEQKETSNNRDINSFIRSKNRINRNIEFQAMKNIDIDNKIEEYRKWQSIIKEELKLIENTDNERREISIIRHGLMNLRKAVQFWRPLESNCTAKARIGEMARFWVSL